MRAIVKLVIAVLLLLCLADMPYGFYQLVRFATTVAFAYFSYDYFKSKRDALGMFFGALAILFQPFFKIALGRVIWNCVDVAVAIALFYLVITSFNKNKK